MANNYTLTSTLYPLDGLSKDAVEKAVQEAAVQQAAEYGWDDPEDVLGMLGLYDFEDDSVWFRHDESADPDFIAAIISRLQVLKENAQDFTFSFCYECSKPRVDEFGGGAITVRGDGEIFWSDPARASKRDAKFGSYADDEYAALLEAARIALADAEIFDRLADEMDLKDEYLTGLRDRLVANLNREG
jgi:hypothetical protein